MNKQITLYAAVILVTWVSVALGNPTFEYKLAKHAHSKPTDGVVAIKEEKRTVFVETDSFGIGSATITLTAGEWPKQIAIRFQYEKGRGFGRLEGFTLTTAALQVRGGMHSSGKMDFYFPDDKGKYEAGQASAGQINVLVEERNGAIELTLPSDLLAQSKDVRMEWVDAYR